MMMSGLPRCPKCRGQTYELIVVHEEETSATVVDGEIQFRANSALPQPVRGRGVCKCGHKWVIRNIGTTQLTNDF